MTSAIMQPYFLPYIGYFQLIHAADQFILYDNIQYTKKGWINRNRILQNGKDEFITLPLKKGSDFLNVNERFLADDFAQEAAATLRKLANLYKKAPSFQAVFPILEKIYTHPERNLFAFIHHSLREVCAYLDIKTPIVISSHIQIDHQLRSAEKVIALCQATQTTVYMNPIGGLALYDGAQFKAAGLRLQFQKAKWIEYEQFGQAFVPWLSILDVMMFNEKTVIQDMLNAYEVIEAG